MIIQNKDFQKILVKLETQLRKENSKLESNIPKNL